MAQTLTPMQMVVNDSTAIAYTAAAANTNDLAEVFTFTPTKPDSKVLIVVNNVAGDQGSVTVAVAAGGFAAAAALSETVAQGVSKGIVYEGAKVKAAAGTVAVTVTPASGKKLLTDHTLTIGVIQLP